MRKIYFLFLTVFSFLSITSSIYSQTVTIGTGTSVQRYPLAYWFGYGRHAMIYTAAEMGTTSSAASVLSVAFFCNTAANSGPSIIYLREVGATTTESSVTWAAKISGAIQVYSGTPNLDAAPGWRTITFPLPFNLSANQNLEVMTECNFGGAGTGGSAGNNITYSTATTAFQFWQADNTPPAGTGTTSSNRPNIQMVLGPPIPCVNPLNPGTISPASLSVCSGTSFTLSVTGASFGAGLTYEWQSSPDGVTNWTAIGTGQSVTTTQSTTTWYRRKMVCSGGADFFSNILQVAMNPFLNCYCSSGLTTNINGIDIITNVKVTNAAGGTLVQASTSNGTNNYQQYNNTPLDLARTTTNSLAITFGTDGTQYSAAWIDYNQDGLFDASENIALASSSAAGSATVTYNFVVPNAATLGNTRLRVRGGSDNAYTAAGACANTAYGETEDYIVNITPAPPCIAPTGVSVGTITASSAVVTFTTSGGTAYVEYGPAGFTPGVGAAAGAGGTVITPATSPQAIGGLTANTPYDVYVRVNCGGGIFSTNSGPINFLTPCNPITTPFTETFASYATTFPPTCWTRNNTLYLTGQSPSAYSVGLGSAMFNFWSASTGTNLDLVSPSFTPVPANYRLTFDHAYATFFGANDQLEIFYSTDFGNTYTSLVLYNGGTSGPLNTAGDIGQLTAPSADQWANKEVSLPVGTNRLRFRGISAFGNNLFLDNITVEPTPSCLPVTALSAVAVSPTSVIISFTPPATTPTFGYIVEYGVPGFTPGTGNTVGGGLGLVIQPGSPIPVPGLTANTTYDFYVRKICIAGVDFSTNKKVTATTLCAATNIPYLQNFESSVTPAPPTCTSVQDVNGNSGSVPNSGGGSWFTYDGTGNAQTYNSPTKTIRYLYDATNPARAADDWFYTQGLNLTAGTNYRLKFFIKASDGPTWIESLEVKYGNLAHSSAMSNLLYTNNNIATALASAWDSVIVDFTPATTGVFYIGFHAISAGDQAFLYLDDVSVKLAPLVDVGITGITVPSLNCPTNNVFVQATVKNYNTTTVNFATYPVTVTANITGAATGTLTATLNTGTLAPGATMSIYLSPTFNFAGGIYNLNVATSSPVDPEVANDAFATSITVNPNPPVPVITPANPAICAGNPVQLSTQFTASPPPVALPAVTSGTISVPIPDNSPAGITHSLIVNSVPAGANVVGINVTINMTHTWIGDMIINLQGANGSVINLINQRGGNGDNLLGTTFTSTAGAPSLGASAAPFTGTFAPDANAANAPTAFPQTVTSLSQLMSSGNGTWTLALRDNAGSDLGTLTSWSITLTYQVLTPIITWTPATGLYTNAGATTAYTGGNAFSLYANPAATTTYNVTATTLAGCTASASTTVTVSPYPVINVGSIPDTVCISDPLIALSATPVGGTWTGIGVSGNNFIPPSTAVGTYTLTYTYTSPAGCTTTATDKIAVKDCPERMILLRDNALLLYPNPSTGRFNIKINSVLYNNLVMKVYTNSGSLVRTQQLGGLAWGRVVPIDLTSLPGGVYMVKFYYDGGARTAEKTFKVILANE